MIKKALFIICIIVIIAVIVGTIDYFCSREVFRQGSSIYDNGIKRALDFFCAIIVLIVFSPIYLVLFILVRLNLGSPVLFVQERVGRDERIFKLYKFRTMTEKKDENGNLLPDSKRLTRFGSFLRSTSLDEIPEVFNILKGDMSIVGPRPLPTAYLPYYTEDERIRHSVRGGLTQPEVLYGLVNPTWDEQLKYEAEYAGKVTFFTDIKIIMYTVKVLFKRVKTDYGDNIRVALSEERSWMNK